MMAMSSRMLGVILLLFAVGSPSAELEVERERDETRLTIKLDRPVRPFGPAYENTGALITTQPAWPWRCWLTEADEITCRAPAAAVPAATPFELRTVAPLYDLDDQPQQLHLRGDTGAPEVVFEAVHLQGTPVMLAIADQPIDPESLRSRLHLQPEGDAAPGRLEVSPATAEHIAAARVRSESGRVAFELRLLGVQPGANYRLLLDAGVRSLQGPVLAEEGKFDGVIEIPGPLKVGIGCAGFDTATNVSGCDPDSGFKLTFVGRPAEGSLERLRTSLRQVGLRPAAELTPDWFDGYGVERFELRIDGAAARRTYTLELPADLRGVDGELATTRGPLKLVASKRRPQIHAEPEATLAPASPQVRSAGMRGLVVERRWLGTNESPKRDRFPSRRWFRPRELTSLSLPESPPQLIANGGIEWLRIGNADAHIEVARVHAPFAVHAVYATGEVWVWATDWALARPLVGVEIDIVKATDAQGLQRKTAVTRTDERGLARLALEEEESPYSDDRLLRARIGGRVVYLPMELAEALDDAGSRSYTEWAEGDLRAFIVTEKPLYRPGENVRFHGWLRRRAGGVVEARKLPSTLKFRVHDFGTAIGDWQPLAVDDFGAVPGEIRLPERMADSDYGFEFEAGEDESFRVDELFAISAAEPLSLEVQLTDPPAFLRPRETMNLQARATYFSGSAAAQLELGALGLSSPGQAHEVFPDHADFEFTNGALTGDAASCADAAEDSERTVMFAASQSNLRGVATLTGTVGLDCDFGVLELAPSATLPGLASAYGSTRRIPLLADRDYLGLAVAPRWSSDGEPFEVRAILLDGQAAPKEHAPIRVAIDEQRDGQWVEVDACELRPDGVDTCSWPARGQVRFRAVTASARAVAVEAWGGAAAPRSFSLLTEWSKDGRTLSYRATAPGSGGVLVSAEKSRLLGAWAHAYADGQVSGEIAASELPAGAFDLALLLVPARSTPDVRVTPVRLRARVETPVVPQPQWLEVEAPAAGTDPGREQLLVIRNDGPAPLDVAIAVADQGLLALVPALELARDPNGSNWFAQLEAFATLRAYSIANLSTAAVREYDDRAPGRRIFRVDAEGPDSVRLDSVEVTGSRINARDVYAQPVASQPGSRADQRRADLADALRRFEGVTRRRFSDSAWWQDGLRLQPGERREIRMRLPDNLTRWRVEVVAFDAAAHAERHVLDVSSSRALEVRPSLPRSVVQGDRLVASTSVYNSSDAAAKARVELHWVAPGATASANRELAIQARATASFDLVAATEDVGPAQLLAAAAAGSGRDAALSESLVASPQRTRTRTDAWWIDADRWLDVTLPGNGSNPRVLVRAGLYDVPGLPLLAERMRDYPHRCYEQIQSRAVSAAALRKFRPDLADWASDELIATVWRERANFSSYPDLPVYFDPDIEQPDSFLPAYTVLVHARLVALGHAEAALPKSSTDDFETHLRHAVDSEMKRQNFSVAGLNLRALRALGNADPGRESQWWEQHAQFGPSAVASALELAHADADSVRLAASIKRLDEWERGRPSIPPLAAGARHWIDASVAAHCQVVAALAPMKGEQARARRWLAGVASSFGDRVGHDSQALSACIDASLRLAAATSRDSADTGVAITIGSKQLDLQLSSEQPRTSSDWIAVAPDSRLRISSGAGAYVGIESAYEVDARESAPTSIGAALSRTLEVRRGDRWELAAGPLQRGEWVRVTLHFDAPRAFDMLVIEESVPGALVPIDTTLEAVADPWIRSQDVGSAWFFERQLGQPTTRFYATWVPPGAHAISYVAQARHAGDFAWLPARIEAMYGRVQRAESAAARIEVRQ